MDNRKSKRVPVKHLLLLIDYAKVFDYVDHSKLWKILKEIVIPDNLTCLLRNLYAGQEATARTGHGTTDWFQVGKGVLQDCIGTTLRDGMGWEGGGRGDQDRGYMYTHG